MDERDWKDLPLDVGETLELGSNVITRAAMLDALLVSGDLQAAQRKVSPNTQVVGLLGGTDDGPCAVQIARDRALFVSPETSVSFGWHGPGFAVSDASDLYVPLDITGPSARMILAQGTGVDLDEPSPSAAVLFAGHTALLVRRNSTGYRLFIETAWLTYYTSFFRALGDPF